MRNTPHFPHLCSRNLFTQQNAIVMKTFSVRMMSFLFALSLSGALFAQPVAPSIEVEEVVWNVDASHSNVGFTVTHLVISEVDGSFQVYDGSIRTKNEDFSNAMINFTVDVTSISTGNEKRDGHLKSDDFFNAEQYPKMTFTGKSFKNIGKNKYKLVGDLTIRDVTRQVTFDVTYGGTIQDPWGNTKAGFKASTTVDRFEYNLKWDAATEAGNLVVGREVEINLNLQFNKVR
jgi:polyisoprenoid-binding protein YceI